MNGTDREILEALDLYDKLVDPYEPFFGTYDGTRWQALGSPHPTRYLSQAYQNEQELNEIREKARRLYLTNPFAINAIASRITYVVGQGHVYRVVKKENAVDIPDGEIDQAQWIIDEFCEVNKWPQRQQEIVRREDRDGECFLRIFKPDHLLRIRFIEPEHIRNPLGSGDPHILYGIEFDQDDCELPLTYYYSPDNSDPQPIDAEEIQHRKRNVDCTAPRGLPSLYATGPHLEAAVKVIRNMSSVSQIQAAIAMIRKRMQASSTTVQQMVRDDADVTRTSDLDGQTRYAKGYAPGTIIDADANTTYEFPSSGVDIAKHTAGVQTSLRAAAAGFQMPEYMLTADASNANFASTLVAEAPAVKGFKMYQACEIGYDKEILRMQLDHSVAMGELSQEVRNAIEIQAEGPEIETRNDIEQAQADQIRMASGVLSPQTASQRANLEYGKEQSNIEQHEEAHGKMDLSGGSMVDLLTGGGM